ncbi:glycosyltransferase [Shewanella sp. A3A]|nr:glycosyltransferase [Shewanella ferrihydritica]
MKSIGLVLVVYGKHPLESVTYKSLNHSISTYLEYHKDLSFSIFLHNNGPESYLCETESSEIYQEVIYSEAIDNSGLSKVYNAALNALSADFYMILDDDTEITYEFFVEFSRLVYLNNADLVCPQIISNSVVRYPKSGRGVIKDNGIISCLDRLSSISSGLILSANLIRMMVTTFGKVFDEEFVLYGVDSSFFLRFRRLVKAHRFFSPLVYCFGKLNHSLSSDNIETMEVKSFREKERIYDLALQTRYYPRISLFYLVPRELLKSIRFRRGFNGVVDYITVLISGCHPRNRS